MSHDEKSVEFELSGGELCLDFANTLGDRPRSTQEHLNHFGDLLRFSEQTGSLPAEDLEELFHILDEDDEGHVSIDEFFDGIMRIGTGRIELSTLRIQKQMNKMTVKLFDEISKVNQSGTYARGQVGCACIGPEHQKAISRLCRRRP